MRVRPLVLVAAVLPLASLVVATFGCGGSSAEPGGGPDSSVGPDATGAGGGDATASTDSGISPPEDGGRVNGGDAEADAASASGTCANASYPVHACEDGGTTRITGTVYDPAGKHPLYGVAVYVPATPPDAIPAGVSCTSCADLFTGCPVAGAITDGNGNFIIDGAPDGASVPLVVQIGKWRRQFSVSVTACGTTQVTDGMLTLPKSGAEGDMPNIAVATGAADTLECIFTRIGVAPGEYVSGAGGTGHIHIFQGNGGAPDTPDAAPSAPASLWDSAGDIDPYDLVVLSCEGAETAGMNQQVLFDYAAKGGRVMASHFHYAWFTTGPFAAYDLATWRTGSNDIGNINADIVTTTSAGGAFPRGQAFHTWLGGTKVNALTNGELPIVAARHNADVSPSNSLSQAWLVADDNSGAPGAAQSLTFDTPLDAGAAAQCGRVDFTDLHVGSAAGDYTGALATTTPAGCATADLSPQESALEFLLFDVMSCVTPAHAPSPALGQNDAGP
jgi:hypothetical protein